VVEIARFPLYNQDDEENPPQPWVEFRDRIRASDAVIFVTPEYNRSIPGAAQERARRGLSAVRQERMGRQALRRGELLARGLGGFGAQHHLRQCLVFLDMPAMQQPEMYLSHVDKLVDAEGNVLNDKTARSSINSFTPSAPGSSVICALHKVSTAQTTLKAVYFASAPTSRSPSRSSSPPSSRARARCSPRRCIRRRTAATSSCSCSASSAQGARRTSNTRWATARKPTSGRSSSR
jgi:NAD(P)H-dependent FMN reductase